MSERRVLTHLFKQRRIIILGDEKSGKTSLAKVIFQELYRGGFIPLSMTGTDFRKASENNVTLNIRRAFEKTYSASDFERFDQLPNSKKAIIIDDFHETHLNTDGRNTVIKFLKDRFDVIVLFGKNSLRFNCLFTQAEEEFGIWDFPHYMILPLGGHLRSALVEKWHLLGREGRYDDDGFSRYATFIERTLSSILGDNFLPAYPIFVLILLQCMEAQRSLDTVADIGASFGFLYETLLTTSLKRVIPSSNLNIMYSYLSELAFLLFENSVSQISSEEFKVWHEDYCEKYRLQLDNKELLDNFCKALVLHESTNHLISFRYPYIYYYFVARYFSKNLKEESVRDYVVTMSKHLHHIESANILLFLGYLSSDSFVLSSVLEASRSLFSKYPELDLADSPQFLTEIIEYKPELALDSASPTERRRKLLKRASISRVETSEVEIGRSEERERKEESLQEHSEVERTLQINVAFKTIQILGQILRNSLGDLSGEKKLELAGECYALGLRTLSFVFDAIQENQELVIEFVMNLIRSRHPETPDSQIVDEMKNFLFVLLESISFTTIKQVSDSVGIASLLLTFDDLLKEEASISYRFIDLSVRLDYFQGFPLNEAESLQKDTHKNPFASYLLRQLIWFYLYIYETPYRLRQSLCDKFDIKILPAVAHDKRLKRIKGR